MALSESQRYIAPALNRGIDALELLFQHPEGLTPADIAEQLSLTVAQLFRILVTLEDRGYIARSGRGEKFAVTLRPFILATRFPPTERILLEAMPAMRDLSRRTGQAVQLAVREGRNMVVLGFVTASTPVSLLVPVGEEFSLLESTAGLFHYAHEPEHVQKQIILEIGSSIGPAARQRLMMSDTERLSDKSHFSEPSPDIVGVINQTTVILDYDHQPVASLTLPFLAQPYNRVNEAEATAALCSVAVRLSEALGGNRSIA